MSNVTVEIAGRRYTIACADGEQPHIEKLAGMIDSKLADMPNLAGQSEARTLLFAALLLADELHEANNRHQLPTRPATNAEPLENMAERLERLASRLEAAGTNT